MRKRSDTHQDCAYRLGLVLAVAPYIQRNYPKDDGICHCITMLDLCSTRCSFRPGLLQGLCCSLEGHKDVVRGLVSDVVSFLPLRSSDIIMYAVQA